jgi:two-component system, NarL family, sensor kinase
MQTQNSEVVALIIAGIILGLMLVSFIVVMVVSYRKRQFRHEQELLNARLEIQESIFRNLSEEIHDNIGQMLSVLKLTLSAIKPTTNPDVERLMNQSRTMVNHIVSSVSDLSKSLHTDRILKIGLVEAVSFELSKIQKTSLFKTVFTYSDCSFELDPDNEIFLFRIIQEIIHNIIKHSRAKTIEVAFTFKENHIYFSFKDDGVGFSTDEKEQNLGSKRGIGLTSMVNRAKLIGAKLIITSSPGKGTQSIIEIPASISSNPANAEIKTFDFAVDG